MANRDKFTPKQIDLLIAHINGPQDVIESTINATISLQRRQLLFLRGRPEACKSFLTTRGHSIAAKLTAAEADRLTEKESA